MIIIRYPYNLIYIIKGLSKFVSWNGYYISIRSAQEIAQTYNIMSLFWYTKCDYCWYFNSLFTDHFVNSHSQQQKLHLQNLHFDFKQNVYLRKMIKPPLNLYLKHASRTKFLLFSKKSNYQKTEPGRASYIKKAIKM